MMNEKIETNLQADNPYLLLTPCPLNAGRTEGSAKLQSSSIGNADYSRLIQKMRRTRVSLATSVDGYTSVLMTGGGTASVESVIGSVIPEGGKLAVVTSSVYGNRLVAIAKYLQISVVVINRGEQGSSHIEQLSTLLESDLSITHVAVDHDDMTTGMLNPIEEIAKVVKAHDKVFVVDAMNSFAYGEVDIGALNIDFMISSADKCIEGSRNIGFVIAREERMREINECVRTSSIDLYDQWKSMEDNDDEWRFISRDGHVLDLAKVLKKVAINGERFQYVKRNQTNQRMLVDGLRALDFRPLFEDDVQSPLSNSFYNPTHPDYSFKNFYNELKIRGVDIYPCKTSDADGFSLGNIGGVNAADINCLVKAIEESMYWHDDLTVSKNVVPNVNTTMTMNAISEMGWIP